MTDVSYCFIRNHTTEKQHGTHTHTRLHTHMHMQAHTCVHTKAHTGSHSHNMHINWKILEDPDSRPCDYNHLIFTKMPKLYNEEKITSIAIGAEKTGYLHVEE